MDHEWMDEIRIYGELDDYGSGPEVDIYIRHTLYSDPDFEHAPGVDEPVQVMNILDRDAESSKRVVEVANKKIQQIYDLIEQITTDKFTSIELIGK